MQGKAEEASDTLKAKLESAEADGGSLRSELNACRDALVAAAAETARLSREQSRAERSSQQHNHKYTQVRPSSPPPCGCQ